MAEGVAFVAASADCALKDAKFIDRGGAIETKTTTTILLDELVVFYLGDRCGPTDPLLLMQVTEFSCGGFVLGVTWSHGIADGTGMAQFLQAVGELARRSPSPVHHLRTGYYASRLHDPAAGPWATCGEVA
ncbi:hypothetical protein HU200_033443 [Digitaria exilis]|uniref:Uncharacterized protein n=1 Tax=Digitaria exilis TaxID=1010633 RepID=A0A835BI61_9POAL|nr:hypothetical protein HU200_033443 [Digitaria exilis]